MPFLDLAASRKTCRRFSDVPLSEEETRSILEAGRLAPSSRNLKDVVLVPVEDIGLIRRLALCRDSSTAALETATFAVIVAADPNVCDVWTEDASIASIMMQLEAEDLGLGSCWIQIRLRSCGDGQAQDAVKREASLDPKLQVLSVIAFGRVPDGIAEAAGAFRARQDRGSLLLHLPAHRALPVRQAPVLLGLRLRFPRHRRRRVPGLHLHHRV